jgi:hypothetical protein
MKRTRTDRQKEEEEEEEEQGRGKHVGHTDEMDETVGTTETSGPSEACVSGETSKHRLSCVTPLFAGEVHDI